MTPAQPQTPLRLPTHDGTTKADPQRRTHDTCTMLSIAPNLVGPPPDSSACRRPWHTRGNTPCFALHPGAESPAGPSWVPSRQSIKASGRLSPRVGTAATMQTWKANRTDKPSLSSAAAPLPATHPCNQPLSGSHLLRHLTSPLPPPWPLIHSFILPPWPLCPPPGPLHRWYIPPLAPPCHKPPGWSAGRGAAHPPHPPSWRERS
jgi:hypothetical protein